MNSDALAQAKATARKAAFGRRKSAHDNALAQGQDCSAVLARVLALYRGKVLAAYMPMRSEISPLPVMLEHAASGKVCVPVILGAGQPLEFHQWTADVAMVKGEFGAFIPAEKTVLVPEVVIAPLVAFDRSGNRLGYGGGFYDRTLEGLRARGQVLALGFAYGAQEASDLPMELTDQPLDAIITENEILWFNEALNPG